MCFFLCPLIWPSDAAHSFLCCDKVYQNVQKALAQTVENISSNAKFVDRLTLAKQGARVREYDSGQECLVVEPPQICVSLLL